MNDPEPTDPDTGRSEPGPDSSVHDIKADIETTRHELGQTVEALTAKLDVKQQAKQKVDDTKAVLSEKADALQHKASDIGSQVAGATTDGDGVVRPVVPIAAHALLIAVVGILIVRRRS